MSKEKEQIDGWVMWHPEAGFHKERVYDDGTAGVCILEENLPLSDNHVSDGWRVRPVKLVFLDADGGEGE